MRVIVVRHHSIDEAGFVADAFAARGADLEVCQFPRGGTLPSLDGADHIVVLGAAWSVYEDRISGWIGTEIDWLRSADAAGIPVLGICFGAQVLTAALGGTVEAAERAEIGWITVETLAPELIEPGPWLEFHHDRCLPPAGARLLARNDLCVQAFSLRQHLAVQFHPEVDGAQVARWMAGPAREEAERAGQDADQLVERSEAEESQAARRAERFVDAALRIAREAVPATVTRR